MAEGEGGAQSFAGHLNSGAGHELAAVKIYAQVMPLMSPLGITGSYRGFDDHRVHGGRCHVDLLGDVGDVLFPPNGSYRADNMTGSVPGSRRWMSTLALLDLES